MTSWNDVVKQKPKKPLEKTLEAECVEWAKLQGFTTHKLIADRGYPDRIFVRATPEVGLYYIEFKREGEKPRQLQEYYINELRNKGFEAYYVDSFLEFQKILSQKFNKYLTTVLSKLGYKFPITEEDALYQKIESFFKIGLSVQEAKQQLLGEQ